VAYHAVHGRGVAWRGVAWVAWAWRGVAWRVAWRGAVALCVCVRLHACVRVYVRVRVCARARARAVVGRGVTLRGVLVPQAGEACRTTSPREPSLLGVSENWWRPRGS
jgi:hypothetical protein